MEPGTVNKKYDKKYQTGISIKVLPLFLYLPRCLEKISCVM